MDEILTFLKEAGTFFFATSEGGVPHVRPFGFFICFEGRLYIGMGDYKNCYKQLTDNPRFEICAFKPETREWMRLSGTAVYDARPEVNEAIFAVSDFHRNKYGKPDGPRHAPFYVKNGVAEFHDMSDDLRIVRI